MASMTAVEGASFGTLNSMMPRCTDAGYKRRYFGFSCVFQDTENDGYYLWFYLVLDFYHKISKEGLQCAVMRGLSVAGMFLGMGL